MVVSYRCHAEILSAAVIMSEQKPLIRFGVIADPQYADVDDRPEMARYYRNSPAKLAEAIQRLNAEDLAFVVTLGDLIDRDWKSFDGILPVYDALRHRNVLLPGNHDFAVACEHLEMVHERLGMPTPWHSYVSEGIRFIVIDGNEMSLFSSAEGSGRHAEARQQLDALTAAGAINAKTWNGGVSKEQLSWLEGALDDASAAGEKVVVMGHYPLFPQNDHNLWNAEDVLALFTRSGNVIAYLNGHNHAGNLGRSDTTWYINFKGMVDTEHDNSFAVVEIFADRIKIIGFGREESRELAL